MKDITEIDKNFKIETDIQRENIVFLNALNEPMTVYGVFYENGKFRRLPESVAKSVSEGVHFLHANGAGGRVKFKTDSPYVAIVAKMSGIGKMPHFAFTGSAGFDLYEKSEDGEVYVKSFRPPLNISDGYESVIDFESVKMRELTLNFPLYSNVDELYIGVSGKSVIQKADQYKIEKPVVYYGSSITQGGCASRPGNSYQSAISRRFDCNYINLGFSGNAKAEQEMIDYVKELEMSLFVYDYDHNAPSVDHLRATHEKMFKAIRDKNPELPIIMMSRPKYYLTDEERMRFEIIKQTYDNAVADGDKNVYFISGKDLMKHAKNDGTVDDCHPNDFGFASMAQTLGDFIEQNGIL